jgi:xylulokinase
MADVTGLAMEIPENGDASYGAALVAGIAAGVFASPAEAVARCVRIVARCAPDPARHALYEELFAIYRDAQQVLAPIDHRLHEFAARCG